MATSSLSLSSYKPSPIGASMSKPDPNRSRKPPSASWWAPLFGWQPEPDYIAPAKISAADPDSSAENDVGGRRSRFMPGCFTEEKARQLRRSTLESSTFHDVMYHSAIASRLAVDLSDRKDDDDDDE